MSFETTWIAGMVTINFLLTFTASKERFSHIYNDALIGCNIVPRVVTWYVFASDVLRDEYSYATYGHSLSIKQMISCPLVVDDNIARLSWDVRNSSVKCPVDSLTFHLRQSHSSVGIKRYLRKLFFGPDAFHILEGFVLE